MIGVTAMSPPNENACTDNEETPLLKKSTSDSRISFRRIIPVVTERQSLRGAGAYDKREVHPVDGLSPLVTGGEIVATDGYKTYPRPASVVKSLPANAPFQRRARHRSFYLWWINEFRHWWKQRYVEAFATKHIFGF